MGFKDSWMVMADLAPNWREIGLNYAMTARDALGGSGLQMRSDDGRLKRNLVDATYTRLLQRWNEPASQANLWLLAGVGQVTGNDFSGRRWMATPGVALDFETTRLYGSSLLRLYRAKGVNHDFASVRLGFSFYEVDYDESQPWLMLEARRMRGLSQRLEITPMVRVIHKRFFGELGFSNASQARLNFMYIF
jgi:hypothetical protein